MTADTMTGPVPIRYYGQDFAHELTLHKTPDGYVLEGRSRMACAGGKTLRLDVNEHATIADLVSMRYDGNLSFLKDPEEIADMMYNSFVDDLDWGPCECPEGGCDKPAREHQFPPVGSYCKDHAPRQ